MDPWTSQEVQTWCETIAQKHVSLKNAREDACGAFCGVHVAQDDQYVAACEQHVSHNAQPDRDHMDNAMMHDV